MSRAPSSAGQGVGIIDEILSSPALDAVREVAENIDNFLTVIENTDEILGAQAGAEAAQTAAETAKAAAEFAEADAEIHQATAANNAVIALNARNAAQAAEAATIVARDAALAAETNAETAATAAAASAASIVHASGTYVPVITNKVNITTVTLTKAMYSRIGNIVTVSFLAIVDGMPVGVNPISFEMSLPIASAHTLANDIAGSASLQSSPASAMIYAEHVNDTAVIVWNGTGPGGEWLTGTFQYEIK